MSNRKKDDFGFLIIENNPVATAGVYGYWGEEIGLPPRAEMYQVLRTPEMLEEAAPLFDGKPIVLEHTFIGGDSNSIPAEQKGVDGALSGATVSGGTLLANLTIYTQRGKRFIDDITARRKAEGRNVNLSLGYRAIYRLAQGVWNGINYDAIQEITTANHLAILSGNGRGGDTIAMLDSDNNRESLIDFEILNNEDEPMGDNEENQDENQSVEDETDAVQTATIQSLSDKLDAMSTVLADLSEKVAAIHGAASAANTEDEKADDKDKDEDDKKEVSTEDGAAKMSALAIQLTAAHTAAVSVVKPLLNYEWSKLPTAKEVWAYAAKKLDLKGDAETAVRTYANMKMATNTADNAATKPAPAKIQTSGTWSAQ
jgi:hypothetical protein